MSRVFWAAPFKFTDDQVQRLLAAWSDSGSKRAKAKSFIHRAEHVIGLWLALRPSHDTDSEIRDRAETVRNAAERLLNALAGASTDFELTLNAVCMDKLYFDQQSEDGDDDHLPAFERLLTPKLTATLRAISESCAVIQNEASPKPGRKTDDAKSLVSALFDAWKMEYGNFPSCAKGGNFARFIRELGGILNIEIGVHTIKSVADKKNSLN